MKKKLHLVSLGCAKNLVDSEVMLGRLKHAGWSIVSEPAEAEIIIINTCSFIETAVNESIDTILELTRFKKEGVCRKLIVTGCLPERFGKEITDSMPEIDVFIGTGAYNRILQTVEGPPPPDRCVLPRPDSIPLQGADEHRVRSDARTAYIKIAEGCSNQCTYCIIPKLRGKQRSRPIETIVAEANGMIASGVRELILVAQDTTGYGKDLEPGSDLALLLENIAKLSPDVWIRVLYGHPSSITDAVIRTIAEHPNICTYFDVPIQHASDAVLKKMGRHYTFVDLCTLFDKIRMIAPESVLRTTAIVGFPGEKDEDFDRLLDFAERVRFDNLGVFRYSDFGDLPSHRLAGHVPDEVAKKRHDRLMSRQLRIASENNRKHSGKVYTVLLESSSETDSETGLSIGRTAFQAPEVDGVTYVKATDLEPGSFINVNITDTYEYDLLGEPV